MPVKQPKEWPYFFCPNCKKLAPIHVVGGTRFCMKCSYTFEDNEGGRVVLLTKYEAMIRSLNYVVNPHTGEVSDD